MTRNSKRTSGIPGVVIWVLVSCFISENSTFICMDCTLFGMSIAVGFFFFEDYKKVILVLEIVISGLMSELQLPSQHPEVAARGPCHMVGLENKPRSLMTLLSH